jgi:hypothetical protein
MARNTAYTLTKSSGDVDAGRVVGKVVYPATAIVAADYTEIDVGFRPKHVQWVNMTDRVSVEHFEGMAANTCLKTAAAGTRTLETTNGGITLTARGFQVLQNATLAAILASKDCYFIATN